MRCVFLISSLIFLFNSNAISQYVEGQLIEGELGYSIVGATVSCKKEFSVSDKDGKFSILAEEGDTILFSHLGYLPKNHIVKADEGKLVIELTQFETILYAVIYDSKYYRSHSFNEIKGKAIPIESLSGVQNMYNKIPGLYMHSGALNTNRLTIRGIGSRSPFSTSKIRAFVNDIPITSGIGETNLEDINLFSVDNISVYKGPTNPIYGAGLGGVIHYKTVKRMNERIRLSNRTNVGSFGKIQNNTSLRIGGNKRYVGINCDRIVSAGYRENNHVDRHIFSLFGEVFLKKDRLSLFMNSTNLQAQIPSALNIADYESDPSKAAFNWQEVEGQEKNSSLFSGLSFDKHISNSISSTNTLFAGRFTNDERRPFNTLDQRSYYYGIRSKNTIRYSEHKGKLQFGLEFFNENEDWKTKETNGIESGELISDNQEIRRYLNVFVQNKYDRNNWSFEIGGNVNFTRYNYEDLFLSDGNDQSGKYVFEPILSPFLSISHRDGRKLYYGTLSHGFSMPTLEETLTPEGLINQAISAETGYNFELGTRQFWKNYEIEFAIYYMYVSNLLVSERISEDQYIGVNAGRTSHPGLEMSIERGYRLTKESGLNWNVNYQYGPHKFIDFTHNDNDFSGSFLPGNPVHKSSLDIDYKIKKMSLQWSNLFTSSMFVDDANSIRVKEYFLSNFSMNYRLIEKANWTVQVSTKVNNLFDVKYASMLAVNPNSFGGNLPRYLYPGLPRNYFVGIFIEYKLNDIK